MQRRCLCARGLALALAGLVPAACRVGNPEAAYLGGDFMEARKYYNAATCAELSGNEAELCKERATQIEDALAGAAQYLGRRANERIQHKRQIQFNRYDEAIHNLELALKIMPADHPSRPDFQAGAERIRETLASLESELDRQLTELKQMLEEGTYDPEVWTEIRLTFERVRMLLLAIGKEDDRPHALAMEFVDKFRRHGQFEHARIATQLADAVIAAGRKVQRHTDDELILFGVIDYLAQGQEAARMKKIEALVKEVDTALESEKTVAAIDQAHAVLDLGPEARTARRMRTVLKQLEGASGQVERAKEAREAVALTATDIAPVPLANVQPAAESDGGDTAAVANASATKAAPKPAVDRRTFEQRLAEILRQYEEKKLYEAFSGLEVLSKERRSSRERRKLAKLRQVWTADRKRVLGDIVKEADRLFVLMDERSLTEYKRAKELAPAGETAHHIKERIETLERILSN